ncbi:MAG: FHA domain-containing protein [Anaerolineae bacterium]
MSLTQILFLLRLLSAAVLIGLFVALAYFLAREIKTAVTTPTPSGYSRLHITHRQTQTNRPLLPVTTIGRAEDNQVVLQDGFASHHHAKIFRRDGRWWLQDLGSRNGSLLNDMPLTETAVLSSGDTITIGDTQIKVEII